MKLRNKVSPAWHLVTTFLFVSLVFICLHKF